MNAKKKTLVPCLNKGISCQEKKGTKTAVLSRVAKLRSVVARVGYRLGVFRYRCQIDTFKTVPVPKPILMIFFFYQLIIGLAISTEHMGPVSQTHRQGLN